MTPEVRTCVVAGRFNPAILSPAWVVAHGLLPDGQAEGKALVGTNVVQYTLGALTWQPTLTKLEVIANDSDADPGDFVSRVLNLLPHTPINAVGSNFVFPIAEPADRQIFPLISSKIQAITSDADHELLSYSVTVGLKFGADCVISIGFESEKEKVYAINFNFNRFVPNASAGAEVALAWRKDEAEAVRIYQRVLEAGAAT